MYKAHINKTNIIGKQMAIHRALQILIALLMITCISCATTWEGQKRTGRAERVGTADSATKKPPAEKEVMRPEGQQPTSTNSPARNASMDMVTKGKNLLDIGNYEDALGLFQEAVIIDTNNGIGYYYMAKSRFYLHQYNEAMGILDKAESLLSKSEEWKEAIALLRLQIETSGVSNEIAKESDLIPIINVRE